MSYDSWKCTDPNDEFLGDPPNRHEGGSISRMVIRHPDYARIMGHCPTCNHDLYGPDGVCPKCDAPDEDIKF